MAHSPPQFRQPHWWTDVHNRAWEHVREAFRAQWDERRRNEPEAEPWEHVESPIRFGFGARRRAESEPAPTREGGDWDPEVEALLEQDWDSMHDASDAGNAPHLWHDVRQFVHRGWLGP